MNESLKGKRDSYSGLQVLEDSIPTDPDLFQQALQNSLEQWREEKLRGVWLKLSSSKFHLLPIAIDFRFQIHHAQKNYIMLTLWLPETTNNLPHYVTHAIGVGGFVVNDKNEVLVIQEKYGPIVNFWKIPGGRVEPNEDIADACIREVEEETGIKTKFESILCFRQANRIFFEMADLYFVCKLKPLTFEIKIQESEIADCKWMPIQEFQNLPHYRGVYKKMLDLQVESITQDYHGFDLEMLPNGFSRGTNHLYYNKLKSRL